jgi:hypothetical protein
MGRLHGPALKFDGHTALDLGTVALLRLELRCPSKNRLLQAQSETPNGQTPMRIRQLELPDPGVVRLAQALSFVQRPALPIFFTQTGREDTPIGQNQGDFVELQCRIEVNQNPG